MPSWIVVEDEPDVNDSILAMFSIWGVDGTAFKDAESAIMWIDDVEEGRVVPLPDLAVIDIRLPGMSGVEVAKRMRHSRYLHEMSIVMMTAYRLRANEEAEIMQATQADALLYKPLPAIQDFRRILDGIVAKR